jgi:ABC-type multidrug transport system permease subunit
VSGALRAVGLLLAKDLRLLIRSPAVLALLVVYPLVVALLVAAALQSDERRPSVALVNLDTSGRSVQVGDERLAIADYAARLAQEVDLSRLDEGAAAAALEAGRVSAVLTIPQGFVADLQSGVRQPTVRLTTSRRSPISGDAIERRIEAAIFRLNSRLAAGYVDQVLALVDLVQNGGRIGVFGRSGEALGLTRSRDLVTDVQRRLRAEGLAEVAADLSPLIDFIDATRENLDVAGPAANAIRSPIRLEVAEGAAGREPLSAFGTAGALLVSLGLAGVLLGAGALSSEREENALARLRRGLMSPVALTAEKMVFTAAACLVIGLVLLVAIALFTSLAVGRWGLWLVALTLAGLAFGAFGAVAGAVARETRSALLAALMVSVPLLALGLLPDNDVAGGLAQLVPFGPAFEAFQTLLVEPRVPGALALTLGHLALLAAVFGGVAAVALRRRPE